MPAPSADVEAVTRLLGRGPRADFDVVLRNGHGEPMVIRNAPLLQDGVPMPTRYWLVDPGLVRAIGRLEAAGGVRAAEREVPRDALERAHAAYARERDAALPTDHLGPRPSGGVGGTREGVKCLHAHYAWLLAGGEDPVGRWVEARLAAPDGSSSGTGGSPPRRRDGSRHAAHPCPERAGAEGAKSGTDAS